MSQKKITSHTMFAFGSLRFPLAFAMMVVAVYAVPLYSQFLGVSLSEVGLAIMCARALGVVIDPIVGNLSDRYSQRFGRKPWIGIGIPVILCALYFLALAQPGVGAGYLFIWASVFFFGISLIEIPYLALGAELSTDYNVRSRIMGVREMLRFSGLLATGLVPMIVIELQPAGLAIVPTIVTTLFYGALVLLPLAFIAIYFLVPNPHAAPKPKSIGWSQGLKNALSDKLYRKLLTFTVAEGVTVGIWSGTVVLLFKHWSGVEQFTPVLILSFTVGGLLGAPVWTWLSGRISKHRTLLVAALWQLVCAILLLLAPKGELVPHLLAMGILGVGAPSAQLLVHSMLADVSERAKLEFGEESAGLYFSGWSMIRKLADAISIGVALHLLSLAGFNPVGPNTSITLLAFALCPTLIAHAVLVCGALTLWRFPLGRAQQEEIRARLAEADAVAHAR